MSAGNHDAEQEAAQAARWAANWRKLEREALQIARAMRDAEARRAHVLHLGGLQAPCRARRVAQRPISRARGGIGRHSQILL